MYYGESGYDDKKQIADIEDLLTKKIDLLIVQPVTETGAAAAIEKAKAAGVKVVIFGGLCGTDKYDAYVDRDHIKTGFQYADWVAKKIGGKGNVVVIMGYPGSGYSNNVLKGVNEALAQYPEIKVLGTEYAMYTPAESKKILESYFAKRVPVDGVIVDGGLMDFGVLEAFTDAKKPLPPTSADDWFGFLKKTVSLKYTNYMVCSSGEELSLDAADVAIKLLKGETVPKDDLRRAAGVGRHRPRCEGRRLAARFLLAGVADPRRPDRRVLQVSVRTRNDDPSPGLRAGGRNSRRLRS